HGAALQRLRLLLMAVANRQGEFPKRLPGLQNNQGEFPAEVSSAVNLDMPVLEEIDVVCQLPGLKHTLALREHLHIHHVCHGQQFRLGKLLEEAKVLKIPQLPELHGCSLPAIRGQGSVTCGSRKPISV